MSSTLDNLYFSIRNKINSLPEQVRMRIYGQRYQEEYYDYQEALRYTPLPSVEDVYQNETTVSSRRSFCGRYWGIICSILLIISIACIITTYFRLKEIAETTTSVTNSTTDFTTESN